MGLEENKKSQAVASTTGTKSATTMTTPATATIANTSTSSTSPASAESTAQVVPTAVAKTPKSMGRESRANFTVSGGNDSTTTMSQAAAAAAATGGTGWAGGDKRDTITGYDEENHIQYSIQQCQIELLRQSSVRSTKEVSRDDLHSRLNYLYSKFLVDFHWLFLLAGVVICITLTASNFLKQPLPDFTDPKRGFSARGEGTLTSKLIVLKNINTELTKYHKHILEIYDKIKNNHGISDTDATKQPFDTGNPNHIDMHTDDREDEEYPNEIVEKPVVSSSSNDESDRPRSSSDDDSGGGGGGGGGQNEAVKLVGKREIEWSDSLDASNELGLEELRTRKIYKKLTGQEILNMTPSDLQITDINDHNNPALALASRCNYSILLNANLEFYFKGSHSRERYVDVNSTTLNSSYVTDLYSRYMTDTPASSSSSSSSSSPRVPLSQQLIDSTLSNLNLLHIENIRSLCHWDKQLLDLLARRTNSQEQPVCYVSLPFVISLMANKTDCDELTDADVHYFIEVMLKCRPLQRAGVLYAFAEEHKVQPEIIELINKNAPIKEFVRLKQISENWCYYKDLVHALFEHVLDRDFISAKNFINAQVSSLIIMPSMMNKVPSSSSSNKSTALTTASLAESVFQLYMKNFHMRKFDDHITEMYGLNLAGIRESAAMRLISQEMLLVAIAITLIVIVTLLYLRSIFISMVVNLGVGMSVGVAFFAYRIVFGWDLFPFLNMMAVFLLIGIACDNVYVLFDSWYAEKARVIAEDLPEMIKRQWSTSACLNLAAATPTTTSPPPPPQSSRPKVASDNDESNEELSSSSSASSSTPTDQVKVVNVQPAEQLLPPIYVKRTMLWEQKSSSRKKKNSPEVNDLNDNDKNQTEMFLTNSSNNNTTKDSKNENNNEMMRTTIVVARGGKSIPAGGRYKDKNHELLKNSPIYADLVSRGIDISDYELNPAFIRVSPLTDEQMIRVMGGTLRHAASSIFVTSFTTAAAFFTNYITKLPSVQLFGIFTGICILIYFCMVITMVASFVITYEKHIQPYKCKVKTNMTTRLEKFFNDMVVSAGLLNNYIVGKKLPELIVKARVLFFLLFLAMGVGGMLIVFHHPKLKPPANWRHEFFKGENMFENFEFELKDRYMSYANDERRNLTNPEIFFVFGMKDKDTGRLFNPDDDGYLIYDKNFDFMAPESQIWLNTFINSSLASRRDLFLPDELVYEWNAYLAQIQQFCYQTLNLTLDQVYSQQIFLPYEPKKLAKCRDELNGMLLSSSLEDFENLMSSFPRRIIFMSNGSDVTGLLLRINANRTFYDFDAVGLYYHELKSFHDETIALAPDGFNSGWYISVAFALYDLQHQLITGTYSSLVASMLIALITLLLTSGNILISIYAIVTISFTIADTIAIFVLMGWELNVLESIVIIMSVGLSVDFSCHYGVAYINSDHEFEYDNSLCCNPDESVFDLDPVTNSLIVRRWSASTVNASSSKKSSFSSHKKKRHFKFIRDFIHSYKRNNIERFIRINDIFRRVGSAVLMAAFTTFLAGFSMFPSRLTSFSKMGQFLMLVMFISYLYATFFFVPLCALGGPTKSFGNLNLKSWFVFFARKCCKCCKSSSSSSARASNSKSGYQKGSNSSSNKKQTEQAKSKKTNNQNITSNL